MCTQNAGDIAMGGGVYAGTNIVRDNVPINASLGSGNAPSTQPAAPTLSGAPSGWFGEANGVLTVYVICYSPSVASSGTN
jgi:hypothetical protein